MGAGYVQQQGQATDKLLTYFAPDPSAPPALQDRAKVQQRYFDDVRAGMGLPSVCTMAQLAAHFGLNYTSVSRIVKLG